ncbi:pyridoxamine 5'-phosphate oxidase family protein [Magnetococcus sp. PR-3]|uniref:pyridoxamine 5'-phosphate oxidase family protein n=1 Tax=Magnetococcus sp. PR-3 TaxID=3120355 RepID=UPI002FCE3A64
MSSCPLHTTEPLKQGCHAQVKRGRKRAHYDRQLAYTIMDEALVAYMGMQMDGQPFVLPTSHWRAGDRVYWHAALKGRMGGGIVGQPVCLTFALLDGLVLARSAFHHSVNYRSLMLFGKPEMVTDPQEKARQLQNLIEKVAPGRWSKLRPMTEQEVAITGVLSMPIDEGSIKMRSDPPVDEPEDYDWPVWAGVVPLQTRLGEPQACPKLNAGLEPPNVMDWSS